MADENGGGNSGSWFLNFKPILLIILAGTVFLGQIPYQNSRPTAKSPPPLFDTHEVEARQWQDPFEAVNEHLAKHKDDDGKKVIESVEDFRRQIKTKVIDNGFKELNVIAVMLPGDTYFEEGEIRRRIRYAVLSGFYTALEYMSEENNHIYYFQDNGKTSDQGVAFEWMVYKPVDNNQPPNGNAEQYSRKYQRPPVLVLWLKSENFTDAPHHKLMSLLESIKKEQKGISLTDMAWKVNVIGPYDSDNLQSLVNEAQTFKKQKSNCLSKSFVYCMIENNYKFPVAIKNRPIRELCIEPLVLMKRKELTKKSYIVINYFSTSATLQDNQLLNPPLYRSVFDYPYWWIDHQKDNQFSCTWLGHQEIYSLFPMYCSTHKYFQDYGIKFQRISSTDEDMANAIAKELKLRGIAPSKDNRVVLIGERDTLYGWHLPKTYETVLPIEGESIKENGVYFCNKDGKNDKNKFEDKCIFKFSYLRGLNGEKSNSKSDSNKAKDDKKDTADKSTSISKMEEADDDSQFDYVRRMVGKIRDLDQQLHQSSFTPDRHVIKAIGILGSDVYDKLLIMQAIHDGFPDAVVFTNGLDARYLHPDENKWTRNLLMVSGFDLALGPELQGDIPPFRDSRQTAFYLATEIALINWKKGNIDKSYFHNNFETGNIYNLLKDEQATNQLEEYLHNPKVYELGKTKIIPLSQPKGELSGDKSSESKPLQDALTPFHSKIDFYNWHNWLALVLFAILLYLISWVFNQVGNLFDNKSGIKPCIGLIILEVFALGWYNLWVKKFNLSMSIWLIFFSVIIFIILYSLFINYTLKVYNAAINEGKVNEKINSISFKLVLHFILVFIIIFLPIFAVYNNLIDNLEPHDLFEGVSMWPTEGLRFIALIAASYLIIQAYQFPYQVEALIQKNLFKGELPSSDQSKILSDEWKIYKEKRWRKAIKKTLTFYGFGLGVLFLFGLPHTPFRGEEIRMLDNILLRGMVVPAFILLLFLVTDTAQIAISLIIQLKNGSSLRYICSHKYIFKEVHKYKLEYNDMHEWISMRFIQELSKEVYRIIGSPMIVVLVIVISRSSVFDNWTMPISLNIVIGLSVAYLLYCDYHLKNETDKARKNAIKSLQERSFGYKRGDASQKDKAEQLDRLIDLLKNSGEMVYKTFIERPIFVNSMYILVALLADMASYSWLTKFF
jgi:hypothetical protein